MSDDNMNMSESRDKEPEFVDAQAEAALDTLLLRFGNDYHRPPDIVPREEMWNAIRHNDAPRHFIHRHPAWSVLAAAVLLLGVGISIGVEAHSRFAPPTSQLGNSPTQIAVTAPPPATNANASTTAVAPAENQPGAAEQPAVTPNHAESRGSYAASRVPVAPDRSARSTAYALASARHFAAVEALLTSYNTSSHDAKADAQMADWARALLSQTRLLLDSPAAKDPARNALLQDLELVLVQMTQLSPANTPVDREMINGAVQHSDVITRLRTAVPAGTATSL
jgi:hypothetical protein